MLRRHRADRFVGKPVELLRAHGSMDAIERCIRRGLHQRPGGRVRRERERKTCILCSGDRCDARSAAELNDASMLLIAEPARLCRDRGP